MADNFERLMIRGLSCPEAALGEVVRQMAATPQGKVPEFAKGANASALAAWLRTARGCLRDLAQSGETGVVPAGANNKEGKDLAYKGSGRQIELKSGPGKSQTAANSGIEAMSWYFGDANKDTLYAIMAESTVARRGFWRDAQQIAASKKATLDALERYFAAHHLRAKAPAPARLANVLRAIALGFTTQKAVEFYFKNGGANSPLLLYADRAKGLLLYKASFLPHEKIEVTAIRRGPDGLWIHFKGTQSGTTVRMGPHWKNSHKAPGVRIEAPYWVSHPCFQFYVNEGRKV